MDAAKITMASQEASTAAGAMIFVVAEDLIPDARLSEHPHLGTWGLMIGFALMMILDVALG